MTPPPSPPLPPSSPPPSPPPSPSPWRDDQPLPAPVAIGPLGWLRVGLRGGAVLASFALGLLLTLLLRPVERLLAAPARPVTGWITVAVCRAVLWLIGLRREAEGAALKGGGAMVANHVSWLDILVLNATRPLFFVAKAEVAGWAGAGWLARATGTLFIRRDRRAAGAQVADLQARLAAGHRLLFFPEGTSTDGRRVLSFKTTLFAALFDPGLRDRLTIQPLTLIYTAPPGRDPRFFGWWADMGLGGSVLRLLAQAPQGRVRLVYQPPLPVAGFDDRKALARALEAAVRGPLEAAVGDGS